MPVEIRELRSDESAFLGDMLYAALAWKPGRWLPPKFLLLRIPQVAIFRKGWGRPGDTAIVAEQDAALIGLVWYRFFTEAEHGEGFVDEETPELAIAVADGHRGEGVGAALMEAIHARARADGIARISLSVDHDNPARRLYERLGYVALAERDDDDRMVLDLV
jgi:ribosomal protein S18 acetylase RimI-like enzyme